MESDLSISPSLRSCFKRSLIRFFNSAAALRVKVSPRISSGLAYPFATSHKTRVAIVSVLPEPAPAITTAGCSADSIILICSSVGTFLVTFAISSAEIGLVI